VGATRLTAPSMNALTYGVACWASCLIAFCWLLVGGVVGHGGTGSAAPMTVGCWSPAPRQTQIPFARTNGGGTQLGRQEAKRVLRLRWKCSLYLSE
jgi:hypothetical protein